MGKTAAEAFKEREKKKTENFVTKDYLDLRLETLEERIDSRFDKIDVQFDKIEQRFNKQDGKIDHIIEIIEPKLDHIIGILDGTASLK